MSDSQLENSEFQIQRPKIRIQNYFKLNNYQISMLGMLLGLNMLLGYLSNLIFSNFKVDGFLVFDIVTFILLVVMQLFNLFYTIFFIEIASWFRTIYDGADWIGSISLNVLDLSFILCFFLLRFFLLKLVKNFETNKKKEYFSYFTIGLISAIFTMLMAGMVNYLFIFDLYVAITPGIDNKEQLMPLLPVTLWFTLVRYMINVIIYLPLIRLLNILKIKHNF